MNSPTKLSRLGARFTLRLGRCVALGAVLFVGCGNGDDTGSHGGSTDSAATGLTSSDGGTSTTSSTPEDLCVETINAYRKTVDAPPLARWTDGETCAAGQAKSDSESGKAHGKFGDCQEFAQDECPGWPGPLEESLVKCLKMMWDEGPGGGHYDNMSNTKYTKVACGAYKTPKGTYWAIQNFR